MLGRIKQHQGKRVMGKAGRELLFNVIQQNLSGDISGGCEGNERMIHRVPQGRGLW